MKIEIYTDGGCHGNPGPGGWAYVIVADEKNIAEKWGAEGDTTNNRMELSAVTSALEALPKVLSGLNAKPAERCEISVRTDSRYVQKGISEWIFLWKKNGWRTSDKKPVKNKDLWQKLDALAALVSALPIKWQWVKGHAGDVYNERCDEMTQKAIESIEG